MKTWRKYRTYTRVQRLWHEYKEVAQAELDKQDGRLVLVSQKLRAFLEAQGVDNLADQLAASVTLDGWANTLTYGGAGDECEREQADRVTRLETLHAHTLLETTIPK